MKTLRRFVKDRDAAYTAAVMDDDWEAVKKFLTKYDMGIPRNEKVLKAGIYKAVQMVENIPAEVKDVAAKKCIELGFNPMVR
jgi:hypothetical protein